MNAPITSNPAIDEHSISSGLQTGRFSSSKRHTDGAIDTSGGALSPSIAEESEQGFIEPADNITEFEHEIELEQDLRNTDEFAPYNPKRDRDKEKNQDERRRQQRRIGRKRRLSVDEDDYTEDDVMGFMGFLDRLWQRLSELVEDVAEEFDNWNKWFKKEKLKPPQPDRSRVTYIRDEYQMNRSPHLWKSNPDRKWILAFGNNRINNVVSSILYKYQNETISKDA